MNVYFENDLPIEEQIKAFKKVIDKLQNTNKKQRALLLKSYDYTRDLINENKQLKDDFCDNDWMSTFAQLCAAKDRINTLEAQLKIKKYIDEDGGRLKTHLQSLNKEMLIELYLQKCYDYKLLESVAVTPKFDFNQEVWGILSNDGIVHTRVNTFRVFPDKEIEYYCKYDEDTQEKMYYDIDEENVFATREEAEEELKKRECE